MVITWVVFGLLLLLDLLFMAIRASLINARLPFLLNLREAHERSVDRAMKVIDRPRLRISLRLAMTVFHLTLAGVGLKLILAVSIASSTWGIIGWMALSATLLMAMEFSVERIVLRAPEEAVLRFAPLGGLLDWFLTPFTLILFSLGGFSKNQPQTMHAVTEEDLKNWVEVGQPEGSLEKGEREMIFSIFHFGETLAREIMVPRIDILALDVSTTLDEAVDALARSGHSRVPVYEETIDNMVGILYAKDLLKVRQGENKAVSLRDLIRPAYFVPEAKKVDELLTEMQSRRVHLAVVVDEYGGVAGLVALEDIVEEIVGEIRDEYDQSEELLYQQVAPGEFIFLGKIDLDDFNEVMGSHLTKDVADTLGGFIYGQIGRIPTGGEQVVLEDEGLTLIVDQVIGRRIRKVRARRNQPAEEKEIEDSHDNG